MIAATNPASASVPFHSHGSVLLVIGLVAVFFWWAFNRLGPSLAAAGRVTTPGPLVTARQKQWIVGGILVTFIFSYWPLHDIAEKYLFLVHMTQHTVFTLIAPVCLLLGSPDWLWGWVLNNNVLRAILRFNTKPIVALLVFNSLIAVTHWTKVVEKSLNNELFHFIVHLVLFTSATFMWLPVINRRPELTTLKTPVKMMYLFAQSIVPTVPAAFLAMSKKVLYPTYEAAPRLIRDLDAIGDQQLAAAIMKVVAGGYLWAIVGFLFAMWWRDSKNGVADDHNTQPTNKQRLNIAGMTVSGKRVEEQPLTWDQVKAEFDRLDSEGGAPIEPTRPARPETTS
jgi:putative membrane protein